MSQFHTRHLEAIREEFTAAQRAVAYVRANWNAPDVLAAMIASPEITRGQIDRVASRLEQTYFVRLFAGFETLLRDHLLGNHQQSIDTSVRVDTVITRVLRADRFAIDPHLRRRILNVRDHRNEIAHGHVIDVAIPLSDAAAILGRFLARLPDPRR